MDKISTLKAYIIAGFYIFPCVPRGKTPLTSDGFKSASNDWNQIESWLKQYPDCNWAVATGPSGLLAVDYDPAKGGTVESFNEAIGMTPETWTQFTGSGGVHEFYRRPAGLQLTQLNHALPGIDLRNLSGYIMIEPSIHPNGLPYVWSIAPWDQPITDAPPNLVDFVSKANSNQESPLKSLKRDREGEVFFPAGKRFDQIRAFGGRLRSMGFGREALYETLLALCKYQADPAPDFPQRMQQLTDWLCTKDAKRSTPLDNPVLVQKPNSSERCFISGAQLQAALSQGYKKVSKHE